MTLFMLRRVRNCRRYYYYYYFVSVFCQLLQLCHSHTLSLVVCSLFIVPCQLSLAFARHTMCPVTVTVLSTVTTLLYQAISNFLLHGFVYFAEDVIQHLQLFPYLTKYEVNQMAYFTNTTAMAA